MANGQVRMGTVTSSTEPKTPSLQRSNINGETVEDSVLKMFVKGLLSVRRFCVLNMDSVGLTLLIE